MSKNPYDQPQPPPYNPYAPSKPQQQQPNNYYQPPMGPRVSPLAIVSLVTGILSLPLTFCCCLFSVPLSLVAIICGAIAIPQCRPGGPYTGRGLAVAGLTLGLIAILLIVGMIILQVVLEAGDNNVNFQMPDF